MYLSFLIGLQSRLHILILINIPYEMALFEALRNQLYFHDMNTWLDIILLQT